MMSETIIFDDGALNRVTAKALVVIMLKLSLIDLQNISHETNSRHKRHLKTHQCYLAISNSHKKLAKAYFDEQKQDWIFFDGQKICPKDWFIETHSNRMEYVTHIDMNVIKKLK